MSIEQEFPMRWPGEKPATHADAWTAIDAEQAMLRSLVAARNKATEAVNEQMAKVCAMADYARGTFGPRVTS